MRFSVLKTIAHNVADSLGSGCGIMAGAYGMSVFGEARSSASGSITVDFLNGKAVSGAVSPSLSDALAKYRDALPSFCEKHGCTVSDFRSITAEYSIDRLGVRIVVSIEDQRGRRSKDEYIGTPARRIKVQDAQGRVRRI